MHLIISGLRCQGPTLRSLLHVLAALQDLAAEMALWELTSQDLRRWCGSKRPSCRILRGIVVTQSHTPPPPTPQIGTKQSFSEVDSELVSALCCAGVRLAGGRIGI